MNNCGAKITIKDRLGIIDQGKLCAFPAKFVKNTAPQLNLPNHFPTCLLYFYLKPFIP